jgi:hypothetical protein
MTGTHIKPKHLLHRGLFFGRKLLFGRKLQRGRIGNFGFGYFGVGYFGFGDFGLRFLRFRDLGLGFIGLGNLRQRGFFKNRAFLYGYFFADFRRGCNGAFPGNGRGWFTVLCCAGAKQCQHKKAREDGKDSFLHVFPSL